MRTIPRLSRRTPARPVRRSAGLAVATGLAFAATVAPAAPAAADTAGDSTQAEAAEASAWLVEQLGDDAHMETSGFPDYGLTADIVLALTSTGTEEEAAQAATEWLMTEEENDPADPDDDEKHVTGYIGSGGELYAGAHAKLALTAVARGLDPTDVGGIDLLAGLDALETDEGRIADQSQWGDYSNVITQSLAILVQERATDEGASEEAVEFLAAAQCPDGGFATTFPTGTDCDSEADGTAFALQALLAADADQPAEDALAWLVANRAADGSWSSDANGAPLANANSTGLAASALTAAGLDTAASRAFLVSLQQDSGEDAGGISYVAGDPADARATAQAVPALAEVSLLEVAVGTPAPEPTDPPTTEPTPTPEPSEEPTAEPTPTGEPTTQPTTQPTVVPVADDEDLTNGGRELADTGVSNGPALALAALLLIAGTALMTVTRRSPRRPEA